MQRLLFPALFAALMGPALAAHAQMAGHAQQSTAPAAFVDGEVRKVDKEARKLTLRHGPIPNLGMGNMTMVFGVGDAAMLDRVKAGDKVRFKAEQVGGQLVVTALEPAK